ncbi:MAG TPA: hypothetical protein VG738_10825 [Chitinophagaceae bacterium]|nr:hypothetical protein [Chitinophagaceae bacterium]
MHTQTSPHKPAIFLLFILLTGIYTHAQKTVEGIIAVEKNFAAYALQYNTRDAFMHFLDTANSIEFRNGDAVKSYGLWSKRLPDSSKLLWQPAFAGIAKSGELGFTTGPWQYKKSATRAPVAAGEFATIWHMNDRGEWKFLVDIGTDFSVPAYRVDTVSKFTGNYSDIQDDDPLTIDRRFIQQYETAHNDAYKTAISDNAWFITGGALPLKGANNIIAALNTLPADLQFMEMGGGISDARDLAYVYGTVRHEDKINNYLRVWQKTNNGFKLLLQVMQ